MKVVNVEVDRKFENLRKLSVGQHSLEEVLGLAMEDLCPECKSPFSVYPERDMNGRLIGETAVCHVCGLTATTAKF